MPQEKKGRNPRVSKGAEKPQCHIHDRVFDFEEDDIREKVCVKNEDLTEFKGKHYCLFHLPAKEKDNEGKFDEKFRARLEEVESRIAAIKELRHEEQAETNLGISYDFRYVFFPSEVDLQDYKFEVAANFSWARFTSVANFSSTTFSAYAKFDWTRFSATAEFNSTVFLSNVDFRFTSFFSNAYFNSIIFSDDADFSNAVFGENSSVNFYKANFTKDTFFDNAKFNGPVIFNSSTFGNDSNIFFRGTYFAKNVHFQYSFAEGYLRFSNLRQDLENKFDFQEVAFEKASRVSFHTLRLRPSWFINVDARKFVFTNINWENLSNQRENLNIAAEFNNIDTDNDKKLRLLEIACRQLAVNAEENNRYEEAAKFRYMAMETRRLEELKHFSFSRFITWLYKWTSGYGENWTWAALVLSFVILFFGTLYATTLSTFDYGEKANEHILVDVIEKESDWTKKYEARFHRMNLDEGLVHSFYVAAFQRPEPKAADTRTKFFIILETIFAPLQAALLALAIRRKFMR